MPASAGQTQISEYYPQFASGGRFEAEYREWQIRGGNELEFFGRGRDNPKTAIPAKESPEWF